MSTVSTTLFATARSSRPCLSFNCPTYSRRPPLIKLQLLERWPRRAVDRTKEESIVVSLEDDSEGKGDEDWPFDKLIGIASLLTVACLWGTYGPVLKLVFDSTDPPLASTLSFIKASISSSLFMISLWISPINQKDNDGGETVIGRPGNWLTWHSGLLWLSALELGLWDGIGTFAQTAGVEMTSPTNATFLIHTATIFTPILSSFAGDRLGPFGWFQCALSMVGCLVVTVDLSSTETDLQLTIGSVGDLLTIVAAILYSVSTVRVGTLVKDFSPRQLAIGNALVALGGSAIWMLIDLERMDGQIDSLWPGIAQLIPWTAILWATAVDTIAPLLRNAGQRTLPPSRAQLLYSTTPFWAVYIANEVLHLDTMRPETWIGGGLILISALLSIFD